MTKQPFNTEIIPKENFREMIKQGKVIRTPSRGGIIYEVERLLEKNALTLEAIANILKIERKTAYNCIMHLRDRHNKKIIRYYNPRDRKYYYCLED
jgi:predicted P-loop ATPase/GTPase